MSVNRDYEREERWQANMWMGLQVKWWIIIFLLICAAIIGVWTFSVVTSGAKGQGDAQIEKNSAQNWVQAQADFHKYYEGILADDRKIDIAAADLKKNPKDQVLQTNLSGLKNHCQDLVATYNTKAKSFLSKDFRDAGLPPQIDLNDPTTNCKEN